MPPGADSSSSPRCGLVILAAGASRRMGSPKQLIEIDGRPLLVRAIEAALAAPVWPVVVVLGANAVAIRPVIGHLPVLVIENPAWSEGMASSIREGVATLRQFSRTLDAAVLALCDQPGFSAATVESLLAAHRATTRGIVAARYAGRLGAPALFAREHFAALTALTGEEGARDLLNADPARVAAVELPELARDLDTPADLEGLAH
jgi:CTP:molybdopterin cytidylyltransferase MocA